MKTVVTQANSVSQKADELFAEHMKPIMVALQADRVLNGDDLYTPEDLFQKTVTLMLYAMSKGKRVKVDPETKLVIIE